MSPIVVYRLMSCRTRIRIGLSVAAVAYATAGAIAQGIAIDRAPTVASPWESPMVWISLVGLMLSFAGVLIGIGSLIQTVKGMREQLERETSAREIFERNAGDTFARKDVLAVEIKGIRAEVQAVLAALGADGKGGGNG